MQHRHSLVLERRIDVELADSTATPSLQEPVDVVECVD